MPRLKPRKTIDAMQTSIRIAKKMYHRLRLPTTSKAPVPTYIRWKRLSFFTGAPPGVSLVGTSRLLHGGAGGPGPAVARQPLYRAESGEPRAGQRLRLRRYRDQRVGHEEHDDQVQHGRHAQREREALHLADGEHVEHAGGE